VGAVGRSAGRAQNDLVRGCAYEELPVAAKLRAIGSAVRNCEVIFVGIPYSDRAIIALSWLWRASGKRVVLMTESKADDAPRVPWREAGKRMLLRVYDAAIVGGPRHVAYLHALGFGGRMICKGYDTVSVARLRQLAEGEPVVWAERPFLFVGRFVDKKNLFVLLEGYARYVAATEEAARRLVMAGDGPLRSALEQRARKLGVAAMIDWPGFLDAVDTARTIDRALALCLVSTTEQWGLVVNEAVALGVPVIISPNVGARETLVRHRDSGIVLSRADDRSNSRRRCKPSRETRTNGTRCGWRRMRSPRRGMWRGLPTRLSS
jgi:glycosyltransferase involved in cell wall biosynthesis